jgi:TolA-binding protein
VKCHNTSTRFWAKLCLLAVLIGGGNFSANGEGTGGYPAPYFQADFTQNLTEWTSALVNPALLYRVNQIHMDFQLYRWAVGSGSLGYQHLGFLYPLRLNHTIGATVLLNRKAIDRTGMDEFKNPIDLGTTSYQDLWLIGNYGIRVQPWLMLGTNIKYRIQNQFGKTAYSTVPGLDLGVYLNPVDHYRFGDIGFSLCLQDLLPAQIKWQSTGSSASELTVSRARFGVRYSALNDNLVGDVEFLIDNALGSVFKNWTTYADMFKGIDSTGAKVGSIPLAYRVGAHVKYMFIPALWLKAGWTNNNIPYVGFNYNLIYPLPEMINYLNFDCNLGYSFIENLVKEGNKRDERGFTTAFNISTDVGPTREQRESKRLWDKLILAPQDAYNEAMRLYMAGKYWEASFAFGKVLSLFPNFYLNDRASWYLGKCYQSLYLNDIARQVYKQALEEYTTSGVRANYLYGLQCLDYREGKFDEALKNHAFIINLYPESEIRPDADYLAGQIQFERKNYNVAEQLFNSIPKGDPNYLYSQYTLSIINVENSKPQAAIQNLMTIVKDTTQLASDQLLQDASNLKLGHVYFEMGDKLRQAVEAYQRVPAGSSYGDEALLATSWAWIKVNQPNVALQTVDRLIGTYSESPLIPESHLVKGYALMLLKRYPEAIAAFNQSIDACKRAFITEADLNNKKTQFDSYTQTFVPTADKIKKNALRKPTNKTLEERPALQKEFDKFAKESKDFFNYNLLAKSHARFFKRKDEILTDAEYALAKATNLAKSRQQSEMIQQQKKQENKIDSELEKLQQELKNSEQKQ